jgi:DNA-binding HxlR family transcriptional regulator
MNISILHALESGLKQQTELRRVAGAPAQTTLRAQLKRLVEMGVVEKHRRNAFPGGLEYELTKAGRELLGVVAVLECWLARAPGETLQIGDNASKAVVKALAEGWSTTMLRALAAGPLSLTELDSVITSLSYPSLERRLAALRLAGLIEARPGNGRGTPYAVGQWLRYGVAPFLAAIRWERRYLSQATTPAGRIDVEAAFLLGVPLIRPPASLAGSCRLAVEMPNAAERKLVGVTVDFAAGKVGSCATQLGGKPNAWALGSTGAWLDAMIEHDLDRLELGGDCGLVGALLDSLHETLFVPHGATRS